MVFKLKFHSVFELENLVHLDVSYNKLTELDEKIVKLTKLSTFNLEGNELEYLPSSMLKMKQLKQINLKNNYLHPLIWRKYLINQVPVRFVLKMVPTNYENTFFFQFKRAYFPNPPPS